ncbi:MAG: hypothetical protein M3P38_01085 [Chloroflexota bacterium]|nr:hypothetical protein [Chloroflexota bacterium]
MTQTETRYELSDSPYRSLLVVLGAGASHDNGHAPPRWNLPLAAGLFTQPEFMEAAFNYEEMGALLDDLKIASQEGGIGIERKLDEIQRDAESIYPDALVELMAVRYYLRHVTWVCSQEVASSAAHGTTTAVLLRLLNRWRRAGPERSCSVVSFNYDTLLERAASLVLGRDFRSMTDYLDERGEWQFFKLHGSANWAQVIIDGIGGDMYPSIKKVVRSAQSIKLSSTDFRIWDDNPQGNRASHTSVEPGSGQQVAIAPAIALPLISKATFVCPEQHVAAFRQQVQKFDALLVVGWRAQETYFLNELKPGRRVPTMVIGRNNGELVRRVLREENISGVGPVDSGFTKCVMQSGAEKSAIERFLSAPIETWSQLG